MSAPPLVLRLSGTWPILRVSAPNQRADRDAQPHEHDVGFVRSPVGIAEFFGGAFHVFDGADDLQDIAAIYFRAGG